MSIAGTFMVWWRRRNNHTLLGAAASISSTFTVGRVAGKRAWNLRVLAIVHQASRLDIAPLHAKIEAYSKANWC